MDGRALRHAFRSFQHLGSCVCVCVCVGVGGHPLPQKYTICRVCSKGARSRILPPPPSWYKPERPDRLWKRMVDECACHIRVMGSHEIYTYKSVPIRRIYSSGDDDPNTYRTHYGREWGRWTHQNGIARAKARVSWCSKYVREKVQSIGARSNDNRSIESGGNIDNWTKRNETKLGWPLCAGTLPKHTYTHTIFVARNFNLC